MQKFGIAMVSPCGIGYTFPHCLPVVNRLKSKIFRQLRTHPNPLGQSSPQAIVPDVKLQHNCVQNPTDLL